MAVRTPICVYANPGTTHFRFSDEDAYAERSEGYMTALAKTGDVDAMLSLSLMYKASEFTPS